MLSNISPKLCLVENQQPRPNLVVFISSVIGFIKGKSAIAIARQFKGKQRNFSGESFWARGYAVSTVGFELEAVKRYIREQDVSDRSGQF